MKKVSAAFIGAGAYLLPMLALAAGDPSLSNLESLLRAIGKLVSLATPIVIGLAVLVLFWGLVKYIWGASDDDKKSGKRFIFGSIGAIFVMVALVGIVKFIASAFDIELGGNLPTPGVVIPAR